MWLPHPQTGPPPPHVINKYIHQMQLGVNSTLHSIDYLPFIKWTLHFNVPLLSDDSQASHILFFFSLPF